MTDDKLKALFDRLPALKYEDSSPCPPKRKITEWTKRINGRYIEISDTPSIVRFKSPSIPRRLIEPKLFSFLKMRSGWICKRSDTFIS